MARPRHAAPRPPAPPYQPWALSADLQRIALGLVAADLLIFAGLCLR